MRFKKSFSSKICPCCGNEFFKPDYNSVNQWENRIYCSLMCKNQKLPLDEYKKERLSFIFSKTILKKSGCIEWKGCVNSSGYGVLNFLGKMDYIHRIVYKLIIGEIPEEFQILHKCDNRPCINPNHLFLGTHQDNMDDMISKRRNILKLKDIDAINKIVKQAREGIVYRHIAEEFGIDRTYANFIGVQNGIRRMPIRM